MFFLIYSGENQIKFTDQCTNLWCKIRVMKIFCRRKLRIFNIICFFQLIDHIMFRIITFYSLNSLKMMIHDQHSCSNSDFLYFISLDSIMFSKRFYIVETSWNYYEIKNIYNLSDIIESRNYKNIKNFYLTNSSLNVVVIFQRSN